MQGFIKKVEKRQVENKTNGNKFWVYDFKIAVVKSDKGDCQTFEHSMGKDFFEKYLAYCGYASIKDIINVEVNVTKGERTYINKDGVRKFIDVIKFMNFVDKNGKAIIMPREEQE